MSIIKLLSKKLDRHIFTTPSHGQKPPFATLNTDFASFYKYDYSEIYGFDNLQNPKSSILMAQGKASDIYKTKQTFFVIQGATTALLAAMKAIINPADKVLVARNCHKTIFNGLILTAGIVDWFMPEIDTKWGIYSEINPEKLSANLKLNNYKAFIMTSPTYEGINSNIQEIARICKENKVYLIVDEAHGSLYNFSSKLPKTAIEQGADVSVNSLHKTAGALNQTALLHISPNIKNIEINTFQKALNIFQTTSPSYPLLANIEACINFLNSRAGIVELDNLFCEIEKLKKETIRFGIEYYEDDICDPTKILLKKQGVSGFDLSDMLFEDANIEDEMCNAVSCLYLCGIGTSKQKIEKLRNALKRIPDDSEYESTNELSENDFQPFPLVKIQPVDTFNRDFMYVDKNNSILKISNKMVIPYPPGIGLLYPGEAIQKWHLDYLNSNVEVMV